MTPARQRGCRPTDSPLYPIRVTWLPAGVGGRETVLGAGRDYPVARFVEDIHWSNEAWSVVMERDAPVQQGDQPISTGAVRFLMPDGPGQRLRSGGAFELYEGPRKVADVYVSPTEQLNEPLGLPR